MDTRQKRRELMHELLPAATTIGLLPNPTNAVAEIQSKDIQAAARTLGLQDSEIPPVFTTHSGGISFGE